METFQKFIDAQENMYSNALDEIRNGKKEGHWMWYIFPQIIGLGKSSISFYFSIKNLDEAREYLENDILGKHIIEISSELLKNDSDNIVSIFGDIDSKKLLSCMTLFSLVSDNDVFQRVIDKFFQGKKDEKTIEICKVYRMEKR